MLRNATAPIPRMISFSCAPGRSGSRQRRCLSACIYRYPHACARAHEGTRGLSLSIPLLCARVCVCVRRWRRRTRRPTPAGDRLHRPTPGVLIAGPSCAGLFMRRAFHAPGFSVLVYYAPGFRVPGFSCAGLYMRRALHAPGCTCAGLFMRRAVRRRLTCVGAHGASCLRACATACGR